VRTRAAEAAPAAPALPAARDAPWPWRALLAAAMLWLLMLAAAFGLVLVSIDRSHEHYLRQDATSVGTDWARFFASSVPDSDLVLEGELPSPPAQDILQALRVSSGVFRFRLYGPRGELVLESESLATRPSSFGHVLPEAQAAALHGDSVVSLHEGDGQQEPSLYSVALAPVLDAGGRTMGVVQIFIDQSRRTGAVNDAIRHVLGVAVAALALVFAAGVALWWLQRRRQLATEARMRYLAQHDALTGALNRESFGRLLENGCRRAAQPGPGSGLAVLCLDLDRFKEVNDTLGHAAGDELLRQVTARLAARLRTGDALARLGGDEFAVLTLGMHDAEGAQRLAQRLLDAVCEPYELLGSVANVGVSVGVALHGSDGNDPETLLRRADLALYQAKADGRNRVSVYDASLDVAQQERRALTQELQAALNDGGLRLHYQPLLDCEGRLTGYEALARWPHPRRGFVPPSEFIALAEQHGLIEELGRWVIETACHEAASWPEHLTVAVNLSAAQFKSGSTVVEDVARALCTSGLEPTRLELEITESMLLNNAEAVLQALHRLRELGARIAMDDFGTGFSSLAYLWRFPFDKLKVDRAFTQGLGREPKVRLIMQAIVSLAHALAIRVSAEGVETEVQHTLLRELGVDELQGYLLGRPEPVERIAHAAGASPVPVADSAARATPDAVTTA
jgi:diguanylate cyclase (GGDEF)-like protein